LINQLLQQADTITTNVIAISRRVAAVLARWREDRQSNWYSYTPSVLYNVLWDDPNTILRNGLIAARDELRQERRRLVALQSAVGRTGYAGRVQTLATIDAHPHAIRLLNMIRDVLASIDQSLEAINGRLGN
jgi:hypothetical protein